MSMLVGGFMALAPDDIHSEGKQGHDRFSKGFCREGNRFRESAFSIEVTLDYLPTGIKKSS